MIKNNRRQPQWLVHVSAAILLLLFLQLGAWQVTRGNFKSQLQTTTDLAENTEVEYVELPLNEPTEWRYKKVQLVGQYLPSYQFLLDNQVRDQQPGYNILTPFRVYQPRTVVLVDRGWVPQGTQRDVFPSVSVNDERIRITGSIYVPYQQAFSLGGIAEGEDEGWPRRIQYVDYDELAERLETDLQPFTLRLDPQEKFGYRRDWLATQLPAKKHYGYAFQWFALAMAVVVLWWIYAVRPVLRR